MMKYLQKLGKALMLPVAALPVAGILMGVGYLLAPGVMGVPGAETAGAAYTAGFLLVKAGGALIDNMAWLFAIGAAVGLADDHDGTAGLAGLVAFLMIQQLLSPAVVATVRGMDADAQAAWLLTAEGIAFSKIAGNCFIGILSAIIGGSMYNKFKGTRLPDWLAFFSGKRCVAIMTALVSILTSVVLLFVWPIIFDGLVALGNGVASLGGIGAGIYAFLNRLLIPTGLHHALNNVFWFDTIGLGDLSHFWAGDVMGQNGANWSVGMYMSGFFPCMMFGIPGAALAMIKTAKNKKAAIGLVVSAAISSGDDKYAAIAAGVLAAVGGKENVKNYDFCATRLRFEVVDSSKVDEAACKAAGAVGVIRPTAETAQVIIGTQVQAVYDELKKLA